MSQPFCSSTSCPKEALGGLSTVILSYLAGALALTVPLLNSMGAEVKGTVNFTGVNISWLSILIVMVWLLSGIMGSAERHGNAFMCVTHALGLPGLLLAVLAIASI